MKLTTTLLIVTIIGLAVTQQPAPKDPNCKTPFVNDPTNTGCNICNDKYGRKKTTSVGRILSGRTLQAVKTNWVCAKCTQSNCANCNDHYNSCTTCNAKYYKEAKQVQENLKFYKMRLLQQPAPTVFVCKRCVSPCMTCQTKDTCLSCVAGFTFANNQCNKCTVDHCSKCDAGVQTCQGCFERFFLNVGKCDACIANCIDCKDAKTCDKCELDYEFKEGECKKKPFWRRFWTWFWIVLILIIAGVVVCVIQNNKSEGGELGESL